MATMFHQEGRGKVEEDLVEGCGREGPILAIFLAEFHYTVGPKIVVQYPPEVVQKEVFDSISSYIIPKTHLQRATMTVNVLGKKIIGYPIQIQDEKYHRNAFYFNTCLVCDDWARTVQYEGVLVKLAKFFNVLEVETEYLSKNSEEEGDGGIGKELEKLFAAVLHGINGPQRECSYLFHNRLLALKVFPALVSDPSAVESHWVPVMLKDVDVGQLDKWDLTTKQILPYIDGVHHVSYISHLSGVNINLVKICLQNLLFYKLIKMVPPFQYSNKYCVTPDFHSKLMMAGSGFKAECVEFVARHEHMHPSFADVIRFFCALKRGITVKDLCIRFRQMAAADPVLVAVLDTKYSDLSLPSSSSHSRTSSCTPSPIRVSKRPPTARNLSILSVVDETKLILFGLVHGLIRRIEKYPVLTIKNNGNWSQEPPPAPASSATYSPTKFPFMPMPTPYMASLSAGTSPIEHVERIQSSSVNSDIYFGSSASPEPEKFRRKISALYSLFDGGHSVDQICLAHRLSQNELDEIIEQDPDVLMIWK